MNMENPLLQVYSTIHKISMSRDFVFIISDLITTRKRMPNDQTLRLRKGGRKLRTVVRLSYDEVNISRKVDVKLQLKP